jgi:hypothetical protein
MSTNPKQHPNQQKKKQNKTTSVTIQPKAKKKSKQTINHSNQSQTFKKPSNPKQPNKKKDCHCQAATVK